MLLLNVDLPISRNLVRAFLCGMVVGFLCLVAGAIFIHFGFVGVAEACAHLALAATLLAVTSWFMTARSMLRKLRSLRFWILLPITKTESAVFDFLSFVSFPFARPPRVALPLLTNLHRKRCQSTLSSN